MKSNDFFVVESHGLRQELSGSMHRRSANLSSEGLVKFKGDVVNSILDTKGSIV